MLRYAILCIFLQKEDKATQVYGHSFLTLDRWLCMDFKISYFVHDRPRELTLNCCRTDLRFGDRICYRNKPAYTNMFDYTSRKRSAHVQTVGSLALHRIFWI